MYLHINILQVFVKYFPLLNDNKKNRSKLLSCVGLFNFESFDAINSFTVSKNESITIPRTGDNIDSI